MKEDNDGKEGKIEQLNCIVEGRRRKGKGEDGNGKIEKRVLERKNIICGKAAILSCITRVPILLFLLPFPDPTINSGPLEVG